MPGPKQPDPNKTPKPLLNIAERFRMAGASHPHRRPAAPSDLAVPVERRAMTPDELAPPRPVVAAPAELGPPGEGPPSPRQASPVFPHLVRFSPLHAKRGEPRKSAPRPARLAGPAPAVHAPPGSPAARLAAGARPEHPALAGLRKIRTP